MRKRTNNLDASFIISGLGAGEHRDAVKELKEIIRDFGREQVDTVSVRLRAMDYPEETFYEVARIAKENKLYLENAVASISNVSAPIFLS